MRRVVPDIDRYRPIEYDENQTNDGENAMLGCPQAFVKPGLVLVSAIHLRNADAKRPGMHSFQREALERVASSGFQLDPLMAANPKEPKRGL